MLKFRDLYLKSHNVDPLRYITIASLSMNIYRGIYLPLNTIAIEKPFIQPDTFSEISILWLDSFEIPDMEHALNGGEKLITGIGHVDGYSKTLNKIWEFDGCFWHGCSKCYSW